MAKSFAETLDEHKRLSRLLLKCRVEVLPGAAAAQGRERLLREKLDAAIPQLEEHFAEEERPGGLYGDLSAALPDCQKLIATLSAEHRQMLRELCSIRDALRTDAKDVVPPELAARTRAILRQLARHESKENQYVFDAAGGRDVGASD
jgi:hypothetical protein